jgi:hypothetical protein
LYDVLVWSWDEVGGFQPGYRRIFNDCTSHQPDSAKLCLGLQASEIPKSGYSTKLLRSDRSCFGCDNKEIEDIIAVACDYVRDHTPIMK